MQLPDNRWSFVTSVSGFYVGNIFESEKNLKSYYSLTILYHLRVQR